MTYEIAVPEPAKIWKELITRENDEFELTKPTPPQKPDITPATISRYNYAVWAGKYGVEVEPCPPNYQHISRSYSEMCIVDGGPNYYLPEQLSEPGPVVTSIGVMLPVPFMFR